MLHGASQRLEAGRHLGVHGVLLPGGAVDAYQVHEGLDEAFLVSHDGLLHIPGKPGG